ncbi:MAG: hypothetical protein U0791_15645 [Gemmataceae bacterium]
MGTEPNSFPRWIPLGGLLLAALYLPTLATPFDFIDDGNLVYPAEPGLGFRGHVALWWEKVEANYEHLGPFRPTLWVHWQIQANLFGGDPFLWRLHRFLWCGLAATMLLWLFRELKVQPVAALLAGAVAMWNPFRNEIWTSLTLAEGVAMPYAIFALIAARKASASPSPLKWELASMFAVLVALGCKNTFAALVPAQMLLRLWSEGAPFREAVRSNWRRTAMLGLTLILPAAHFIYFKNHWHPGQYETQPVSLAQFTRILNLLKGTIGLEFLGAGIVLSAVCLWKNRQRPPVAAGGLAAALVLLAAGIVVYLPMSMIAGRYAMPAVWGLDILLAMLLTTLISLPASVWKKAAFAAVCAAVAVVAVSNVGRQEKFAARAKMLWEAVDYAEKNVPPGTRIAWMSGDSAAGGLNIEEGIHFQWHLYHRGRGDLRIGLFDEAGKPLNRVELPPLDGEPAFAFAGKSVQAREWEAERNIASNYWLGRKKYECQFARRSTRGFVAENAIKEQMKQEWLKREPNPLLGNE